MPKPPRPKLSHHDKNAHRAYKRIRNELPASQTDVVDRMCEQQGATFHSYLFDGSVELFDADDRVKYVTRDGEVSNK